MKIHKNNKIWVGVTAIVVVISFFSSCSSYHPVPRVYSSNLVVSEQKQESKYVDLTQILRQVPHLRVIGYQSSASIVVTRNIKYRTTESPLFIIDGADTGNLYSQVYYRVRGDEVKRIEVMNDSEAMSTYGSRGRNGAVIIKTYRGESN